MKNINIKSLIFNIFSCIFSAAVLVALFVFGETIAIYISKVFINEGWFYSEALTNQISRVFDRPYIFFQVPVFLKKAFFIISCVSTVITIIITFARSLIGAINSFRINKIDNRAFSIISLVITLTCFISTAVFMIIATTSMWTCFFSSFLNTFITAKITKYIFFFIQVIAIVVTTAFVSIARVKRYIENRNENSITLILSVLGIIVVNFVSGLALYLVGMLIVLAILLVFSWLFIQAVLGLLINN